MTKNKKPKVAKKQVIPVKPTCPACGSTNAYITLSGGITCRNCGFREVEEKARFKSTRKVIELLKFGIKKIKLDSSRVTAYDFLDEYVVRIKKTPTFEGFSDEKDDE